MTLGRFIRPRGIDYDPATELFYCVDWSGRVQKFSSVGRFKGSWIMPEIDNGKPEDVCIALNGNILVADTHYSRIIEFSPAGRQVNLFGSFGREPGQFIYPVGICRDDEGNIFVSEYGENDERYEFPSLVERTSEHHAPRGDSVGIAVGGVPTCRRMSAARC